MTTTTVCQVFKPLYYWDAGRHAVAREPSRFLTRDGLIGRAFMLHPFKLSSADAAKAFWQVCVSRGCAEVSEPGKGVLQWAYAGE